jgi:crotonobetainyl-CoA:carnitine CoA-transferase CaiB-like acyl-CoA transferase
MSAYRGLRVVDFSQGVAGPMAAMLLGDLEAEVVKAEPAGGDRLRDHPGYLAWNRNKQVLEVDLASAPGIAAARDLIAGADVAIFDHAPGRLEILGLDGAALTAAHPSLVHLWMPPYGTGGRWSHLAPHHSLLSGLTAVAFRQGAYEDRPVHLVSPILWNGQAVMGAAAAGAAIYERTRSGRGQAVTVGGLHGASQVGSILRILEGQNQPRGIPPGINPRYRLYRCEDGEWFFLGTLFEAFYRRALDLLDLGDAFEALESDMVAANELLIAIFETRPRAEWLDLFRANDVPCAPVGRREAWFAGQTVAEAGLRPTFQHPRLGEVTMPGPPADLSATPATIGSLPQAVAAPPVWPARPDRAQREMSNAPLAGVRVLNLGSVIAGSYSGAVLANLGADVIKIEPLEGDVFRSDFGLFILLNQGQRTLALDLKSPAGRDLFLDLAKSADVVIDNYRHGVRERLGVDYATLKAINPRVISASITAYGRTGARAGTPGFDPLMQAEGGMMAAQGGSDDPVLLTVAMTDVTTASVVAASVIAALNARERTGEGQEIVTSLMAQSLLIQTGELVEYAGRPPNDGGSADCIGVAALHRYYACSDGWIGVVCETAEEADALAGALDVDLGPQPLVAPRDGEISRTLERAFAVRTREAVLAALLDAGVAAAPALRTEEALADPWLWDEAFLANWRHPRLGPIISGRVFADFARTPSGYTRPTPDLGEHSVEILAEWGVAPARIEELLAAGVVLDRGVLAATAKAS